MSLVVSVSVNNNPPIAIVAAQRTSGDTDPASENTYAWEVHHRGADGYHETARGQVQHRYGDGALALVCRVLDAHETTTEETQ